MLLAMKLKASEFYQDEIFKIFLWRQESADNENDMEGNVSQHVSQNDRKKPELTNNTLYNTRGEKQSNVEKSSLSLFKFYTFF